MLVEPHAEPRNEEPAELRLRKSNRTQRLDAPDHLLIVE